MSDGNYRLLLDIIEANADNLRQEQEERANPTRCPRCRGELDTGPNGGSHCRFDGWRQR